MTAPPRGWRRQRPSSPLETEGSPPCWHRDLSCETGFVQVRSFDSCFLEGFFFFIINGCGILSKAFSTSIEIIIWFLFFNLLMWYIMLIDLRILKNPCIPEIKPTWSWCMIFLMYCWIHVAIILLRIFASMLISDVACNFLFFFFPRYLCLVLISGWWWWPLLDFTYCCHYTKIIFFMHIAPEWSFKA